MISDRYADSLDTILVVGDISRDVDNFYHQTKERDGYPVLCRIETKERFGCTAAVADMVRALGARASVAYDNNHVSVKRRIIVDGRVLCRLDEDKQADPMRHLPPAAVVLIADYAKGGIDDETMAIIGEKYAGKEIIADWHPSRPLGFYACATALKVSWDCPVLTGRPTIRTFGMGGMNLSMPNSFNYHHYQAQNKSPLDCCGAGDMVLATLGVGCLRGLSWQECCEWASENAAECCRHWGSVATGIKTYEDRFGSRSIRPPAHRSHPLSTGG